MKQPTIVWEGREFLVGSIDWSQGHLSFVNLQDKETGVRYIVFDGNDNHPEPTILHTDLNELIKGVFQ